MVNTVNAPPGTTGQIHGSITAVMRAFGAAARPLYLPDASAGPATADCASLVVYLDVTKGFNAVVSRERLAAYTVEALQGFSTWVPLAPPCAAPVVSTQTSTGCIHGLSVGAMVVDVVDWVRSPPRQVRFRCLESLADPVSLRSFAVAEVDLPSELWAKSETRGLAAARVQAPAGAAGAGAVGAGAGSASASSSSAAAAPAAAAPPASAERRAREGRERRRAEPLWTPLAELARGEYESAKVPGEMLKSSHAGLEKGQVPAA
ncbi:unnamed protein product [Prorocentrum cordatum]|uniref:Uncharacterized protein n=1 Tax=Prorocentrum cordatum TaxID=2364126 RepID=A0ABN9S5E1_9DINO|nr:unnamed protein product [Polarella glacialis]